MSPHQGDIGGPQFDSGVGVMTVDEQKNKRKKIGLCPTCGKVKTHKPGLWKAMMPKTIEGLVYKGICLNCSTLDAAQMLLGEPITGSLVPDDMARTNMRILGHNSLEGEDFGGSMPQMKLMENNGISTKMAGNNTKIYPHTSSCPAELDNTFSTLTTRGTQSNIKTILTENPQAVKITVCAFEREKPKLEGDDYRHASMPSRKLMENNDNSQFKKTRSMYSQGLNEQKLKSNESDALPRLSPLSLRQTRGPVPDSTIYSKSESEEVFKCLVKEPLESKKRKVKDFRCSDCNGGFGFYTGTVKRFFEGNKNVDLPEGGGAMAYDDGRIEKGVWTRGNLKMKVASERERYEPCLLSEYSIGDVGHNDDMVKSTTVDVSKLHVGDCAFIKRSGGTWSYAILKDRSDDGDTTTITFQINRGGSTKTIPITHWAGYVSTSAKPDILPQYLMGDPGRDEDMIIESREETVKSVSKLKIGDAAFVMRSGSSWTYAIVKDRTIGDEAVITFQVNVRGSTKVISVLHCGKFVRRVKHSDRKSNGSRRAIS